MNKNTRISFLGDISLNDGFIELIEDDNNPFKEISSYLKNSEFVVGNLESMAKGNLGQNKLKVPTISTTTEALEYLKFLNLKLVSLAHNHIYDHLIDGFNKTIKSLEKNNISYIGAGKTANDAAQAKIIKINNKNICFLNYVTEDTNPNLPVNAKIKVNFFRFDKILADISHFKSKVDFVILLLHWGGKVDYGNYPHWKQVEYAHNFIDAGADLLIGHHTHSIQAYEKYKDKYIFYSLGNFYFSDVIFKGKKYEIDNKTAKRGLIVELEMNNKEYKINLIPVKNTLKGLNIDLSLLKELKKINKYHFFIRKYKILFWIYYYKNRQLRPIYFYFFGNDRRFFVQLKKYIYRKHKSLNG